MEEVEAEGAGGVVDFVFEKWKKQKHKALVVLWILFMESGSSRSRRRLWCCVFCLWKVEEAEAEGAGGVVDFVYGKWKKQKQKALVVVVYFVYGKWKKQKQKALVVLCILFMESGRSRSRRRWWCCGFCV